MVGLIDKIKHLEVKKEHLIKDFEDKIEAEREDRQKINKKWNQTIKDKELPEGVRKKGNKRYFYFLFWSLSNAREKLCHPS